MTSCDNRISKRIMAEHRFNAGKRSLAPEVRMARNVSAARERPAVKMNDMVITEISTGPFGKSLVTVPISICLSLACSVAKTSTPGGICNRMVDENHGYPFRDTATLSLSMN